MWRESLLAKNVLSGLTKGYKNHPQLERFKNTDNPEKSINTYLSTILNESIKRNYSFNKDKIDTKSIDKTIKINVTNMQILYESELLKSKLLVRDIQSYNKIKTLNKIEPNPIVNIVHGNIESWEKIKPNIKIL